MIVTVEEYRESLGVILTGARLLSTVDVPTLLGAIERAETVGPFVEPTLWQQKAQAMREDKELLEAALPLWRHVQKYTSSRGNP